MGQNSEQRVVEIIVNGQKANASIKEMTAAAAVLNSQVSKIAADDPKRAELIAQLQEMRQRLVATRQEVTGLVQSEAELAEKNQQAIATGKGASASFVEMKTAAGLLEEQLQVLSADDPGRAALIADYQELKTRMAAARQEMEQTTVSEAELRAENLRTVESGKATSASFLEMKAAAGVLERQLHEVSADDPGRAAMIADYQALRARMSEARQEMEQVTKTEAQLRAEEEALRQSQQELIVNGKKVSASLREMKEAGALLEKELENMAHTDPGFAAKAKEVREMRERIAEVSKEAQGAEKSMFGWQDALTLGGVTVGLEAAVDLVKEMGAAVAETTKEFLDLRSSINTLTGATGPELDVLTAQVAGIAKTFGKENDEVLQAANVLSKQMGISQTEALRLIQQGFLAGADASGEFLDQVKEYPAQFKTAGLSASQAIGIIAQSVTTGVFSDKGADVIKEFGLRIREQTTATSDAMQAAFGEPFTKKIFDGINKGTLTTAQALQMVAKEMDETQVPASRLQTVVADVFGGPGEDAGIDYLKSLKNVGKGIDELVDNTNAYTQRQQALLASETELAAAQNSLAKEFEGTGTSMTTIGNEAKTLGYTLLASLVVTFKELFQPLRDVWNSFMNLAAQMKIFGGEGITVQGVARAIGSAVWLALTPLRLLVQVWGWLATSMYDWEASSPGVVKALKFMTFPLQLFLDMLLHAPAYFAGFKAAAMDTFGSVSRLVKAALSGDLAGVKAEFLSLGDGAGDAFMNAYRARLAQLDAAVPGSTAGSEEGGPKRESGGDGSTTKSKAKDDKDAAAQAKKDAAELAAKQKLAEEAERKHQEMLYNVIEAAMITRSSQRERELGKIEFDALRKALTVTGSEQEKNAAIALINAEAQVKKQELQAKFDEEDVKQREQTLQQQLDAEDANQVEREAYFQEKFEAALMNQQQYDDILYQSRKLALERELALVAGSLGAESKEYRKIRGEQLKLEKDHNKQSADDAKKLAETKQKVQEMSLKTAGDVLSTTIDLLFQDEAARKKHHNMYTALAGAKLIVDGVSEVAAIWKNAADLGPIAGPIVGGIQTALAVARTVVGLTRLQEFSFAKGGRTGGGQGLAISPMGQLLEATGMAVGSDGKLTDDSGFAVAGVVHENEYVIPAWLRQDPQVAAFENWVEAKRLRGFYEGGLTTKGAGSTASVDDVFAGLGSDGGSTTELLTAMLGEMRQMNGRLADVKEWQSRFEVVLDTQAHQRAADEVKQVQFENGIRA